MPKVFHLSVIKVTLVEMAEEFLSLQDLEHLSKMFYIFFWCLAVHKNVVQVYQHVLSIFGGRRSCSSASGI